jgi:hypothetical protein
VIARCASQSPARWARSSARVLAPPAAPRLAGAALGSGYGAYKTKNECGTIFGDAAGSASAMPGTLPAMQARTDRINIYSAR